MIYAGFQLVHYSALRDEARSEAESAAVNATRTSAESVDNLLTEIGAVVDGLTTRLTNGDIGDGLEARLESAGESGMMFDRTACNRGDAVVTELERSLCEAATSIPELNGIGVIFDPSVDAATDYRPYANRIDGPLQLGELAFRDPLTTDWYVAAAQEGALWIHPRFGATSQTLLAIYASPFFAADGSVRGVMIASYTLDQLADDLRWLGVGATGYSMILSDRGLLLSHPQSGRVEGSFATDGASPEGLVAEFGRLASAGGGPSGLETGLRDDVTNADAWLVYEPIPSVGWTFGAVVVEPEVLGRTSEQTRTLLNIALAVMAALLLIAVVVFRVHRGSYAGIWALSIMTGLFALLGIGLVWYLTISGPSDGATSVTRGSTAIEPPAIAAGTEPISAGVFVQSVEFTGANDVTVSGIAWQELRSDEEAGPPGFVLPEADESTFTEQYREVDGNLTRVGWAFTASLRQAFDYSRYPLDRETVWLRLWPGNFSTETPLLPDLTSYTTLAASTKPGIERDFVVEGWTLDGSSFSYRDNVYNTSFGPTDRAGEAVTELYFNVHLKRSFLDAMMSQLVPLAVVAVLLFGVLLITTEERILSEQLGFSTLAVLGYCAALFFVVIVSHNELRSELRAQQVIYLEYFYFAAYAAILAVSTNAILVGSGRGGRIIGYRDNVVPSWLFWPVLNGALLLVTVVAFY